MQRCMRNVLYSMLPYCMPFWEDCAHPKLSPPMQRKHERVHPMLGSACADSALPRRFHLPTADPHLELVQVNPSGGQLLLVGVLHGKGRQIQPFSAARAHIRRAGG